MTNCGLASSFVRRRSVTNEVFVATRSSDYSLFPITKWPVPVHVARILIDDSTWSESLEKDQVETIAWGGLYESEEKAWDKSSF